MLVDQSSTFAQVKTNGCEFYIGHHGIHRVVDANYAHVLGHAAAAGAQGRDDAHGHLVVGGVDRGHLFVFGKLEANAVTAICRPVARHGLCRLQAARRQGIAPARLSKRAVD